MELGSSSLLPIALDLIAENPFHALPFSQKQLETLDKRNDRHDVVLEF